MSSKLSKKNSKGKSKSRSRSSSSSSSLSKSMFGSNIELKSQMHNAIAFKVIMLLISLALQSTIIYYLINLEDASCKCVMNWRHNFIKATSVLAIVMGFVNLITDAHLTSGILGGIILILGIIQIYALYTYIGDLNSQVSPCACAVVKQPKINEFMKLYRYVLGFFLGLYVIFGVLFVIGLLFAIYYATKLFKK